jgi:hypothetical protein
MKGYLTAPAVFVTVAVWAWRLGQQLAVLEALKSCQRSLAGPSVDW